MNKISPAWRYYAGLYKSVLGRLAFSVLLLVSQSFLYLPVVFLVRYAFNTALPNHDWQGLAVNTLGAIACLLVISIIGMWARRQALQVGRTVVEQFRFDLFQRLNNFSRRRYTKLDLQHYRFSMISETDRLESMNFAILTQMLPGILGGMMLGFILIYINWKLVTVFIATLPILMGIGQLIRTRIAASHDSYIKALRNLAVEVNLMASLLDLIHVQSAEQDELDARKISISNLGGASQSLWSMRMFYNEFQNLTLIMIALLIFLVGSRAVIQGDLLASDLAIFYLVLGLLLSVLRPVWGAYPQLVTGNLSLNHLHDLLTDSDDPPYTGQRRLSFSGHIRLERVTFGYETQAVLSEFNLDIAPSEIIALSGANGIGKTTLIHLLLGFYRPWQGQLFADGIPYSDLDITSLRAQMGIVTQNTLLWPGSLWDNLTYGNQSIPRSVALEASHLACVDEFVAQLPHGYDTILGELGVLLSGGQRQRVAIARALMRKPKLLVLDEPTNHLDKQTAQKILETISNLPYAPAVLFVTHDSSVIKYAQRVVEFRSPNVPVAESDYE